MKFYLKQRADSPFWDSSGDDELERIQQLKSKSRRAIFTIILLARSLYFTLLQRFISGTSRNAGEPG
jgi:hypothetical protein